MNNFKIFIFITVLTANFSNVGSYEILGCTGEDESYYNYSVSKAYPYCHLKCFEKAEECKGYAYNNKTKECRVALCEVIHYSPNSDWQAYATGAINLESMGLMQF